jgi:hypothetical protein
MKPYGIKKGDYPKDCTDKGKYGASKLHNKCSCGAKKGKKTKDIKSRKARERNIKLDK